MDVTEIELVSVSRLAPLMARWEECRRLEQLGKGRERVQLERMTPKVTAHRASIADEVSCEQVLRHIAPACITAEDTEFCYCSCPRHGSRSGRSLHVNRDGMGWWFCHGCGTGGKSWMLAQWLSPTGMEIGPIFDAIVGGQ